MTMVHQYLFLLHKQDIGVMHLKLVPCSFSWENYVNYVRDRADVRYRAEFLRYGRGKKMEVFILFFLHSKEANVEYVMFASPYSCSSSVNPQMTHKSEKSNFSMVWLISLLIIINLSNSHLLNIMYVLAKFCLCVFG